VVPMLGWDMVVMGEAETVPQGIMGLTCSLYAHSLCQGPAVLPIPRFSVRRVGLVIKTGSEA